MHPEAQHMKQSRHLTPTPHGADDKTIHFFKGLLCAMSEQGIKEIPTNTHSSLAPIATALFQRQMSRDTHLDTFPDRLAISPDSNICNAFQAALVRHVGTLLAVPEPYANKMSLVVDPAIARNILYTQYTHPERAMVGKMAALWNKP